MTYEFPVCSKNMEKFFNSREQSRGPSFVVTMKFRTAIPLRPILLAPVVLTSVFAVLSTGRADPTFWTGPNTNFAQTTFASPPQADVLVPGKVSITRNFNHWLYNTNVDKDPFTQQPGAIGGSPSDTEWAFGDISDYNNLSYQSFDSFRTGDLSAVLVTDPPSPMVCHLINEDIYFSVTFTAWPQGGGLISYTRSTPSSVVIPPTPTVSITNPAPNAVFAAPANVKISADASVSSGTVTNVLFFGNNSPLGSAQTAPFSITANGLGTGSYNLTAVATAAGISATSSVVSISVVAPVSTSLSGSSASSSSAKNQFSFSYTATPNLSYVVEGSSNLINWTPLVTNVPSSSPVVFTNPISGGEEYFRVGRLPNP